MENSSEFPMIQKHSAKDAHSKWNNGGILVHLYTLNTEENPGEWETLGCRKAGICHRRI